ncbi:putative beta-lactamase family protein [Neofusicoccum parvum]|nr:putative beta-lactamase family protein [Neofusicoccum parvum]
MTQTSLLNNGTKIFGNGLEATSSDGEPAALSMVSSSRDLAKAGKAMLDSSIVSPADTRRWLKPVTSTSNLRNSVGRPWEIYHFGMNATDPVVDIYTKTGSIGRYSSYFGLAPDHNVGFSILAYDENVESPDLNAYADVALEALLAIDKLGRAQAKSLLAGTYQASASANSSLVIRETGDSDPGLSVETLVVNGKDWRTEIAGLQAIKPEDLDFRLYPTNLQATAADGGMLMEFRAVFQDKSAPIDQGTPTCISWMGVNDLLLDGKDLGSFTFHLDHDGNSTAITISALGSELRRS